MYFIFQTECTTDVSKEELKTEKQPKIIQLYSLNFLGETHKY